LVNKHYYGARMPLRIVPQSWVNLFFSTDTLPPIKQLPYWRIPGNGFPDYNHLVMLNIPAPHQKAIDKRSRTIKRLVAAPGDEVRILDAEIWVNDKLLNYPTTLQWNYLVETRTGTDIEEFLKLYEIREGAKARGRNRFIFPFTTKMADSIANLPSVRRISKHIVQEDEDFNTPFGTPGQYWTSDNFGPVIIPYKGFSIRLDEGSPDLYLYHILYHERQSITIRCDSVFLNGVYASSYTFKNDYYFFLGDNRHNTFDSRLWGMVPANHIIGRVSRVLFSFDKEAGWLKKVRWNRFFHHLDTWENSV
jgi:signal peptidase I